MLNAKRAHGQLIIARRGVIIFLRVSKMKHEVRIRIRMIAPPPGVRIQVQRGRDELLPPAKEENGDLIFEFNADEIGRAHV